MPKSRGSFIERQSALLQGCLELSNLIVASAATVPHYERGPDTAAMAMAAQVAQGAFIQKEASFNTQKLVVIRSSRLDNSASADHKSEVILFTSKYSLHHERCKKVALDMGVCTFEKRGRQLSFSDIKQQMKETVFFDQ
ncbi:Protein of unknown function [Gryllus bimaculatus]|nr:Protein of unknown function [Gryllus bimaculatus]